MTTTIENPNVDDGIQYWTEQPATVDGVLGGYGTGSLPRIDALGSRQFLLSHRPDLCIVPSALKPLSSRHQPPPLKAAQNRVRALDVGAGVGRVTADVLLHLVDDVVLLEPVAPLIEQAIAAGRASASVIEKDAKGAYGHGRWKGIADKTKSVTFIQGTLQTFDPSNISVDQGSALILHDRVGFTPDTASDLQTPFDVLWCQWCLGHLSEEDLIIFLQQCKAALRDSQSLIVVKENLCSDMPNGEPRIVFDESDSSLTRSDMAWKEAFTKAGLRLIDERVQDGLPDGLYVVKAYALR
jgi:protein N-terminal methyltransferase